jgi:hypothetical protein
MFFLIELVSDISAFFFPPISHSQFSQFVHNRSDISTFSFQQLCVPSSVASVQFKSIVVCSKVDRILFTVLIAILPESCCFMVFNANILLSAFVH